MFQNPPRYFKLCQVLFRIPNLFTKLGVVPFSLENEDFLFEYLVYRSKEFSTRHT